MAIADLIRSYGYLAVTVGIFLEGNVGLGTVGTSAIFLTTIVALVACLSATRKPNVQLS